MIKDLLRKWLGAESGESEPEPRPRPAALRTATQFAAVNIVGGKSCCEAARAAAGTKILAHKAPRLPLQDCSDPDRCECRYEKHVDRRAGDRDRRIHGLWQPGMWREGLERRNKKGRREVDR